MYKSLIISTTDKSFIEAKISMLKDILNITQEIHPDQHNISPINGTSIGVKESKSLIKWSELKPFQAKGKLGVIYQAELLTVEAQNSLLKLLEEPNNFTQLVLVVNNYKKLLPTILSRCELIEHRDNNQIKFNTHNFSNKTMVEKLKIVDTMLTIKDKTKQQEEITNLLTGLIQQEREGMFHSKEYVKHSRNAKIVHETAIKLSKNASKRILLENLIFNLQ